MTELSYAATAAPFIDDLHNQMPPRYADEFGEKIYGKIFRYDNGDISVANEFSLSPDRPPYETEDCDVWRPSTIGYFSDCELNDENQVVRLSESIWMPFECYSTTTMYNCGPFAPCLFRPGDASDAQDPLADAFQAFRMMHFLNQGGVSRASTNGNVRMVAGREPTWVGSLVPEAYNNKTTHTVSLGLGGEFGLLIGLMALAQHHGRCDEAFTDPQWARNRWTGRKPAPGCKLCRDLRGCQCRNRLMTLCSRAA